MIMTLKEIHFHPPHRVDGNMLQGYKIYRAGPEQEPWIEIVQVSEGGSWLSGVGLRVFADPDDMRELCNALLRAAAGPLGQLALDAISAVEMGRRGGKKGGAARAARMTPEQRSKAASIAAKARWARLKP